MTWKGSMQPGSRAPLARSGLAALAAALALALSACASGGEPTPTPEPTATLPPTSTLQYGGLTREATPALGVPTPLRPSPAARLADVAPTFMWTTVQGAVGYQVALSQSTAFPAGATVTSDQVASPPWTPAEPLDHDAVYYWRVRALFPQGVTGPWSDYSPFTTPPSTPGAASTPEATPLPPAGVEVRLGPGGTVVAVISVWDPIAGTIISTPDRTIGEVLASLQPGRFYYFTSSVTATLNPRDYGVDHGYISLRAGERLLVLW